MEKQIAMKIFRVRSLLQTSYDDNLTKWLSESDVNDIKCSYGFCLFTYIVANVFECHYVRWLNGDVAIFATIVLTKVLSVNAETVFGILFVPCRRNTAHKYSTRIAHNATRMKRVCAVFFLSAGEIIVQMKSCWEIFTLTIHGDQIFRDEKPD